MSWKDNIKSHVKFNITEEDMRFAIQRSSHQKKKDDTLTKDGRDTNERGALAVIIMEKFLGKDRAKFDDKYDNDLLVDDIIKLEVKEQGMDVTIPMKDFSFDIVKRPYRQKCDYVAFVLINNSCTVGYVLGILPGNEAFDPERIRGPYTNERNGKRMEGPNYRVIFHEIIDPYESKKILLNEETAPVWEEDEQNLFANL